MILAIDPGAASGWAIFNVSTKSLTACGLNNAPIDDPTIDVDRAVIERPHTGQTKARKEDILTLAIRAGEWGGRILATKGVQAEYIEPTRWKGSTPKDISQARIWSKLGADEKEILAKSCEGVAPSKRNNVVDAVGIGLWAVGR